MAEPLVTSQSAPTRLFPLSGPAGVAESLFAQALTACAQQMGLPGIEAVVDRLRNGDAVAYDACQHELAHRVAEYLSSLDRDIKAVYRYEYAWGGAGKGPRARELGLVIHLVVVAGRRTAALLSVLAALDRALTQVLADWRGGQEAGQVLDVHLIDDADMRTGAGYAALLYPPHREPVPIWTR